MTSSTGISQLVMFDYGICSHHQELWQFMLVTSGTVRTRDLINIEKRVFTKKKCPELFQDFTTKRLGWNHWQNWCCIFWCTPPVGKLSNLGPSWMTVRILGCSSGADFPEIPSARFPTQELVARPITESTPIPKIDRRQLRSSDSVQKKNRNWW